MPDEDEDELDFEIELDWEEEPVPEELGVTKYKVGDKVVAMGSYRPGGDRRSIAVVQIEKIIDWRTVSPLPSQTGTAYVVKHLWGEHLAMPVVKKKKVKGEELIVAVEGMYYVDKRDIHPFQNERSLNSIYNRLFPSKGRKKRT